MMHQLGARWFKCDLHLHTTASQCFKDKKVSAADWVQACVEKGLDCVAVTDHNTASGIPAIQAEAKKHGLYVYPGVEITCDTSKVHLLILFDIGTEYRVIEDFLIVCGIKRDTFGAQEAFTVKTVFEVTEEAHNCNALVIPAHIDEFNGLGNIGALQLANFYSLDHIQAVQVVHQPYFENQLNNIEAYLNKYYQNVPIDQTLIKNWQRPVRLAKEKNLAITTFSDNPHVLGESKHGLWGIGNRYTWIKMDARPTLESLRQAFLLPKFRIINDFEVDVADFNPNQKPDLFIKSISIKNCILNNKNEEAFTLDFHHQLNTIIGSPGSGKSCLLKCIRGILKNTEELKDLDAIWRDHHELYKLQDKYRRGVFKSNSEVKLIIESNHIVYEIISSNIRNTDKQDIEIYKIDHGKREVQKTKILSLFKTEHYSQKHIFEIAQEPNALRERIDNAIDEIAVKKEELQLLKSKFLNQSSNIRRIYSEIYRKNDLEAEIQVIDNQLNHLNKSGINEFIKEKEDFVKQQFLINSFKAGILSKVESLDEATNQCRKVKSFPLAEFKDKHKEEIATHVDQFNQKIERQFEGIKAAIAKIEKEYKSFENALADSIWNKDVMATTETIANKKRELKTKGISELDKFEELSTAKSNKEQELSIMKEKEQLLSTMKKEKLDTQQQYFEKAKEISEIRKTFLHKIMKGKNIKIKLNRFRDKASFEKQIRKIIKKENEFEKDINVIVEDCFRGRIEDKLVSFRKKILALKHDERTEGVSKSLNNLFGKLENTQIDELQILVPEDEITISYKPKHAKQFLPLSNASAGQKATAILTFMLSFGRFPLILDQPEDDLNGKLVYELIVDKLQEAKKDRQIIIVTHDANIPVNADAELITCLSSDKGRLEINCRGTVDQLPIKREICDVMEGSVEAFDRRAKRYRSLMNN